MVSERGKGKGKVGQRSSSRNAGRAAEIVAPDVVPTSAAVLTLASVQPLPAPPAEHDAGALEASLTLASLSMPVLAAGVLGPGQVAQLPGSPGTRADIPAGAESTAEQDKEEQRKKASTQKEAARERAGSSSSDVSNDCKCCSCSNYSHVCKCCRESASCLSTLFSPQILGSPGCGRHGKLVSLLRRQNGSRGHIICHGALAEAPRTSSRPSGTARIIV